MLTSQAILNHAALEPENKILQEAAVLLGQSWDGANHQVLAHPTLGQIVACEAETKAQRFVFGDKAYQAAISLWFDHFEMTDIVKFAKSPFKRVCIDAWPHCWLISEVGEYRETVLWCDRERMSPIPICLTKQHLFSEEHELVTLPHSQTYIEITREHFKAKGSECSDADILHLHCGYISICMLPFLNINGCAKNKVTFAPRQQRRAAKRAKKPCLISHNQVTLTFPKPDYPDSGENHAEHSQRRHHAVIGHFRALTKGRDEPKLAWVQPHFRGDPRMGVVTNTRHVTLKDHCGSVRLAEVTS